MLSVPGLAWTLWLEGAGMVERLPLGAVLEVRPKFPSRSRSRSRSQPPGPRWGGWAGSSCGGCRTPSTGWSRSCTLAGWRRTCRHWCSSRGCSPPSRGLCTAPAMTSGQPRLGKPPKCDIIKISSVIQDVIYLSIRHESSIFCAKIQNFCCQKMI